MSVEDSKQEGATGLPASEVVGSVMPEAKPPEAPPAPKTTAELYADSFPQLRIGDIVTGRVVKRLTNAVLVDIGLKAEGVPFQLVEWVTQDHVLQTLRDNLAHPV